MESKKWYESKVILVNLLMALVPILSVYSPSVGDFIKENFAAAGMGWALLNILLRAFKSNISF